ncbi:alkaline phosphatase D family protein, partial [Streptococcus suis]
RELLSERRGSYALPAPFRAAAVGGLRRAERHVLRRAHTVVTLSAFVRSEVATLDRRTGDEPAPIRNMDSWAGYDAPRERVLAMLDGVPGAVVLTGDEHQNFLGELRRDGGRGKSVATEFVSTSISSGGDGADVRKGADRIAAENPFLAWTNDRRGYLLCDVDRQMWRG